MTEMRVERYGPDCRQAWDDFVSRSKNGVFLFDRGYMDYHRDRFRDHSLLFHAGARLVAVLPATEHDHGLTSHGGLTFGGVLSDERMKTSKMLAIFEVLRQYLAERSLGHLLYKAVPHIYHHLPAEEDLYALFRANATLVRRDVSSTIRLSERVRPSKGRRSSAKGARRDGVCVQRSHAFHAFMELEARQLAERHDTQPVHTGDEMAMLAERFPENIKLFTATLDDDLIGGCVVYESRHVAHAQYIGADDRGRDLGALDLVISYLLDDVFAEKRFFDFGISTEDAGRFLNEGLIRNKEGFGARATVYDFYEVRPA